MTGIVLHNDCHQSSGEWPKCPKNFCTSGKSDNPIRRIPSTPSYIPIFPSDSLTSADFDHPAWSAPAGGAHRRLGVEVKLSARIVLWVAEKRKWKKMKENEICGVWLGKFAVILRWKKKARATFPDSKKSHQKEGIRLEEPSGEESREAEASGSGGGVQIIGLKRNDWDETVSLLLFPPHSRHPHDHVSNPRLRSRESRKFRLVQFGFGGRRMQFLPRIRGGGGWRRAAKKPMTDRKVVVGSKVKKKKKMNRRINNYWKNIHLLAGSDLKGFEIFRFCREYPINSRMKSKRQNKTLTPRVFFTWKGAKEIQTFGVTVSIVARSARTSR